MKSFKEYVNEDDTSPQSNPNTDDDDATTTTAGVANPDPQPARSFVKTKFAGHDCIDVDSDTYQSCIRGKKPFSRWAKFIEDEDLRNEVRGMFKKRKRVLMRDASSGHMSFVK